MIDILRQTAEFVLLAYVPGALLFRLPIASRERRAALGAEERMFWSVVLSVAGSLIAGLTLAVLHRYSFARLLMVDGTVSVILLAAGNRRLLYRGSAERITWQAALPIVLVALGLWRFFPPAEYIIGGKDPGVYMNEGIQIAQRGAIVVPDPVVAAVPEAARSLFFSRNDLTDNYGRFMGFFVDDLAQGTVVGQFPHLFPVAIAIGYGLNGLSGARQTVGILAILGVLAVYFASARLVGWAAAFSAAVLLSLHVIEVWFGRYPNTEVLMQALLFAALLAFARAHQDDDRFFAPVSGTLLALLIFLRVDALLAVCAVAATAVLLFVVDRRATPRLGFFAPLAIGLGLGCWYLTGPMHAYGYLPTAFLSNLPPGRLAIGAVAALVAIGVLFWLRARHAARAKALVPLIIATTMIGLAAYAWFFRQPVFRVLAPRDAYALRTFVDFYLFRAGFMAALLGLALLARRDFWRDPALIVVFAAFCAFYFYKIRINSDHFWLARRFLPMILPGALILVAGAALSTLREPRRGWHLARPIIGAVFLVLLGQQYLRAAAPVMANVEYAGIIPYLEKLAGQFGDRDLVIVESRDAGSDVHVLGLPLAYIYARNVLVLSSAKPDKPMLQTFLADALKRYDHVYFVGGGGTDLLSRHILADAVSGEQKSVPEYDAPIDAYPSGVRRKDFDYSIYRLSIGTRPSAPFTLDLGTSDDLNVVRFFAKERTEGRSIRWTAHASSIYIPGLTGREREVVLTMHDGGRPAAAPPAQVEVLFNGVSLGTISVGVGFRPYRLALPESAALGAAADDDPAELRLISTVWNPHDLEGKPDTRNLGVMVSRVEVR